MTSLDVEIDRIVAAIKRRSVVIDKMSADSYRDGDCCPSCRFGRRYTSLCDQNDRSAEWLMRLLSKRALVSDGRLASWIRFEYPTAWDRAVGCA